MRASSTQVHEAVGLVNREIVAGVGEVVAWPSAEIIAQAEHRRVVAPHEKEHARVGRQPLLQQPDDLFADSLALEGGSDRHLGDVDQSGRYVLPRHKGDYLFAFVQGEEAPLAGIGEDGVPRVGEGRWQEYAVYLDAKQVVGVLKSLDKHAAQPVLVHEDPRLDYPTGVSRWRERYGREFVAISQRSEKIAPHAGVGTHRWR